MIRFNKNIIPVIAALALPILADAYAVTATLDDASLYTNKSEFIVPATPSYHKHPQLSGWSDNWFSNISVGGNAFIGSPMGCGDLFDRTRPTLQLSVGKWHLPFVGNRIVFEGFQLKDACFSKKNFGSLHFDFLWDLTSTFNLGQNFDRFQLTPFIGGGIIDVPSTDRRPFALNYGVIGSYKINDKFSVSAEFGNATTLSDADGVGKNRTSIENLLSLKAGLTYNFGKHINWRKIVDAKPFMEQNDQLMAMLYSQRARNKELAKQNNYYIQQINEYRKILEIEGLLAKYADKFISPDILNKPASNDYSGLNSLRQRLKENELRKVSEAENKGRIKKKKKSGSDESGADNGSINNNNINNNGADVKKNRNDELLERIISDDNCIGSPIFFFFRLGKSELVDGSQTVNLDMIAKVVDRYGLVVEILGAGDSETGSKEINQKLGAKRADFIADYLIDCGIDADNIKRSSQGGISTYDPQEANRNAIVRLLLPE